jgi:hypothetical protein
MISAVSEVEQDRDVVARQERGDERVPAKFRPTSPRTEIARGAGWSVIVSRAQDGLLIEHVHSDGRSGRSTGRLPDPSSRSHVVVVIFGTAAGAGERCGLIGGLVTAAVVRVQVQLRDGTIVSADTDPAPKALDADLRTFVMETPLDEQPFGPDYPPAVHEYLLLSANGSVLQRLASSREPRRS